MCQDFKLKVIGTYIGRAESGSLSTLRFYLLCCEYLDLYSPLGVSFVQLGPSVSPHLCSVLLDSMCAAHSWK